MATATMIQGETAPGGAAASSDAATAGAPVSRSLVEHDGQKFALANQTSGKNVETDEYVLVGEKIEAWTQLVTVQRLNLTKAMPTSEFVTYFQQRLQTEDGASLDVLKQTKTVSVFAVRFPKSDRNDEQVMICLAFADAVNPALLNIVQYAIKPTRVAVDVVESQLKSWRDKLLRQAQAIETLPAA